MSFDTKPSPQGRLSTESESRSMTRALPTEKEGKAPLWSMTPCVRVNVSGLSEQGTQIYRKELTFTSLVEGPLGAKQQEGRLARTGLGGIRHRGRKVTRLGVGQVCSHMLALLGLGFPTCKMEATRPTSNNWCEEDQGTCGGSEWGQSESTGPSSLLSTHTVNDIHPPAFLRTILPLGVRTSKEWRSTTPLFGTWNAPSHRNNAINHRILELEGASESTCSSSHSTDYFLLQTSWRVQARQNQCNP